MKIFIYYLSNYQKIQNCHCTNAIQETLEIAIKKLKISKFIILISTKNVLNPKPHPEIYLKCMINLNSHPKIL